jgi:transaldolase
LADFRSAGIDLDKLASDLQSQGAKAFDESWSKLLDAIEAKGEVLHGVV